MYACNGCAEGMVSSGKGLGSFSSLYCTRSSHAHYMLCRSTLVAASKRRAPNKKTSVESLAPPWTLFSSHVPVPNPTALGCWLLATHRRLVRWKCRLSTEIDPAYIIMVPAFCKGAPTSCRKSEKNLKMPASLSQISTVIKFQPLCSQVSALRLPQPSRPTAAVPANWI